MPQALSKQLAGKRKEILNAVQLLGKYRAMAMFNVRDTLAWDRLLYEWTKGKSFGHEAQIPYQTNLAVEANYTPLVDLVVERVSDFVSELQTTVDRKNQQIERLRKQLEICRKNDYERQIGKLISLLNICKQR